MAKEKEIKEKVIQALESSAHKWRTARGISKDSQIPIKDVTDFLERSSDIVRSKKANNQGQPLYTTKDKYKNTTSLGKRLIDAMLNREPSDV